MQKSVGILRFLNFKKFAKQKEKPAQLPGFLIFLSGGSGCIHPPHLSKNKTTQSGGYIFWWATACANRAENKREFTDLMQWVKEFKEKWLND